MCALLIIISAHSAMASGLRTYEYETVSDKWNYKFGDTKEIYDPQFKIKFDECYGVLNGFSDIEGKYGIPNEVIVVKAGSKMHVSFPDGKVLSDISYSFENFKNSLNFFTNLNFGPAPFGWYMRAEGSDGADGTRSCSISQYEVSIPDNTYTYSTRYFSLFKEEDGILNYEYENDNGICVNLKSGLIDYHLTLLYDTEAQYPQCIMDWNSAPLKPVLALTDEQAAEVLNGRTDILELDYTSYGFNIDHREYTYQKSTPITAAETNEIKGLYSLLKTRRNFIGSCSDETEPSFTVLMKLPFTILSMLNNA